MRSKRLAAVALVLASLVLAACGEKNESVQPTSSHDQTVTVMLDWFPNADHVGLYQALAEGDFSAVGLHVIVRTPSDPSLPLKLLAAGQVDLAISYEPQLLIARDQGAPLTSIAAIVQEPLTSIVAVGSKHIRSPRNLRGKRVGTAGIPYQTAFLDTILAANRVPLRSVKTVDVGDNLVPAMLSGQVDATMGAYWNYEAIQLAQLHKHPTVMRVDRVGVPTYDELVLVARQSTILQEPDVLRRFVQALGRGYESARRDPRAAVANLLAASPGLDQKFQLAAVQATMPAFFPASPSQPWGSQNQAQWSAFGQWMLREHLISNPSDLEDASTNDFLAGFGP